MEEQNQLLQEMNNEYKPWVKYPLIFNNVKDQKWWKIATLQT
jgi:hypothetical protein